MEVTEIELADDMLENDTEKFINIVGITRDLLQDGQIPPLDVMILFCDCVESGIFPPEALLKIIAGNFEKFINSCCYSGHPTLDELFRVSGNKVIKKKLLADRDDFVYKNVQRLINIGLSEAKAYEAVCEKYQDTFKTNATNVKIKPDLSTKRVEQVYKAIFAKIGNIYDDYPHAMPSEEDILSSFPPITRKRIKKIIDKKRK